jgi:hypothetical protein
VGDEGLEGWLEGNEMPDSRGGMSSRRPVGKRRSKDNKPELFANTVIDSNRGSTRITHAVGKCIGLDAGKRDRKAECKAMEDCC